MNDHLLDMNIPECQWWGKECPGCEKCQPKKPKRGGKYMELLRTLCGNTPRKRG